MPHSHRFGRVEIRPTERLVLVDGQPAPLGARAFDVLMALVERKARVVSKNELLDVVWPNLVVEENNLAVQVSALRKLLGPQAIATVPGRGYRFAAVLQEDNVPPGAGASRAEVTALPALAAPLLGRDDELSALAAALAASRLVTIVGAGGIGKTSLALSAAHAQQAHRPDGVGWIDLAALVDASLIPAAVAQAVGLPTTGSGDPLPALVQALKPLQLLLVLDNAEHLLAPVSQFVRAVLAGAPGVHVLATSQAALKLDGERLFRLDPLSVPPADAAVDEAMAHGAVALFVDQASAADRRFALTDANVATVVALCRRLDGIALALKLAAARLPLLGLDGLVARLDERLKLLGGGARDAPARQQTLQAALDWSHGLLRPVEQAVFRRLGVFAGGFALGPAAAVAGGDGFDEWQVMDAIGELVERSLVAMEPASLPRYRLLETTRDYARAQLDATGERERVQRLHAQAMAALMDTAYESSWSTPDRLWLVEYGPDLDNVRVALDWSTAHAPELALRLAGAAGVLFMLSGHAPEARRRMKTLESFARTATGPAAARYWLERSRMHWGVSNPLMHDFALAAGERYRAAGDRRGLYMALRGAIAGDTADTAATAAMLQEMAELEQPDWPPRVRAQRMLAENAMLRASQRLEEARVVLEALAALAGAAGLESMATVAQTSLASTCLALGDEDKALRCARALVADPAARRSNFVLQALVTIADVLIARDEVDAARQALADLIAAARSRDWEWFGLYADRFAWLAAAEGRAEAAACLLGHADAAWRHVGERDAIARRAHDGAATRVGATLDAPTRARLMDEGARMDAEAVCALTLAAQKA